MEKLRYALAYGADAVYIGGTAFGLRAYAGNFTLEEMKEAVLRVHAVAKKLYVTVNVFAHEADFDELPDYLSNLARLGVDALIVSDPGVLALAREVAPGIALHLSTQANSTNSHSVRFWLKQGVKRVVLARELSLAELSLVRARVPGELEIFVHGAMCMSYSGRCLLSNYLTGRDANRGECAQPCRWGYSLMEEKRPGQVFPLEEDERGTYIFNSHDLCLLPYLPRLAGLGIESCKIEGRMKSIHYVASTVKVYREALDVLWEQGEKAFERRLPEWLDELDKVSHRDYSPGFLFGKPGSEKEGAGTLPVRRSAGAWPDSGVGTYLTENVKSSHYVREYDFVGVSLGVGEKEESGIRSEEKGEAPRQTPSRGEDRTTARKRSPGTQPSPGADKIETAGKALSAYEFSPVKDARTQEKESSCWANVEQRNRFQAEDRLEVLSPGSPPWSFTVTDIFDSEGRPITAAPHAQEKVRLKVPRPLPPFTILRRAKAGLSD
ncbi:peptidase U32 family protein [Acididesulfobacillus acetoxydans]|nr:U32 family peptidase [Acididesulfobacillus acetoxydans]